MTENIERRQLTDWFNLPSGRSMALDPLSAGMLGMQALSFGSSVLDGGHSARKSARSIMDLQNQYAVQNWNMQNEYNAPINQLARLREAGLNPNYLSGSDAGNNSSAPQVPQVPSGIGEHLNLHKVIQLASKGALDALEVVQGMNQRHLTTEGMRLANQKALVDLQQAQHDLSMRQKYDDDYFKWRTKGVEGKYLLDQIRHGLAQQQFDFSAKVAQDRSNKIRYDANLEQLRYDNQKFDNEIMNPLRRQLANLRINLTEKQVEQLGWNIKNTILQGGLLALNYEQLDTMLHGDVLDQLGAQNWGQALMKILINLFSGIGNRWLGTNGRKY